MINRSNKKYPVYLKNGHTNNTDWSRLDFYNLKYGFKVPEKE